MKVSVSLVIVMGLTWAVGIFQFHESIRLAAGYLFSIFIGVQGILIFLLLVPLSKNVCKPELSSVCDYLICATTVNTANFCACVYMCCICVCVYVGAGCVQAMLEEQSQPVGFPLQVLWREDGKLGFDTL